MHLILVINNNDVYNSCMAKGEPGRAQTHPNVGCTVLANTQYTLIEQSLILLMYYIVHYQYSYCINYIVIMYLLYVSN